MRPINYDPQAAKTGLLAAFRAKGFADTSLSDLEAASELDRRQLYNGFGDKQSMFLAALDASDVVALVATAF